MEASLEGRQLQTTAKGNLAVLQPFSPQELIAHCTWPIWKLNTDDNTWRRVTAILYWAQMVAWALISAPRDWSLASARKDSSKQDNASESWFCSRWTSPILKHIEAAAPRGTCYEKSHEIRKYEAS